MDESIHHIVIVMSAVKKSPILVIDGTKIEITIFVKNVNLMKMKKRRKIKMTEGTLQRQTCCICGERFIGWGNNPWPVVTDEEARCCDECNNTRVIPARIAQMFSRKEG